MYIRGSAAADHTSINFGIRKKKKEKRKDNQCLRDRYEGVVSSSQDTVYRVFTNLQTTASFVVNEYVCMYVNENGREKSIVFICKQHNDVRNFFTSALPS